MILRFDEERGIWSWIFFPYDICSRTVPFSIHELLIQRCMNIYEHTEMLKHCIGWFFAWKRLKRASTYVLSVPRSWPTPQWHVSLRKPFISSDPRITHDCHVYRVTLSKINTVNLFFSKQNCGRYAFDLSVCIRDFRKSIFFLEYSVPRKFLIFATCKRKWNYRYCNSLY